MPRPFNKEKTDSSTNCAEKTGYLMQKSEVVLYLTTYTKNLLKMNHRLNCKS